MSTKEFDGGYNRIGKLAVKADEECVVCNTVKVCLVGDPSEGEYAEVTVCLPCVMTMFDEYYVEKGKEVK